MKRFDHLLRFTPIYQTRVWGGRQLERLFGRELPDEQPYGESWELVDRPDQQSRVAAGPWAGCTLHELWTTHRASVFGVGGRQSQAERFPLLVKILDCRDDLSIQVHPPALVAATHGGEPKTEMWFVAHAERGARMWAGLEGVVGRDEFERALANGTVASLVHALSPVAGDSLFVPSGRVHALGAGLVVFEIQQNSDTTYRVFDWNRLGLDGRPRALHIDESLRSIDFEDRDPSLTRRAEGELASCDYFTVSRSTGKTAAKAGRRGRLVMAVAETTWGTERLRPGDLALCPADLVLSEPTGDWLEIEL